MIYVLPTISPHQKFEKGLRKAKVHLSYRPRNVREELNSKPMQWFLNRGPIYIDASHYGAFFMYLGCWLKISIALNPKKKP